MTAHTQREKQKNDDTPVDRQARNDRRRPGTERSLPGPVAVVGIGSSGPLAGDHVDNAMLWIAAHPQMVVVGKSPFYKNPPAFGVTAAPFVNAAVVVRTALGPEALLRALFALEAKSGRIRIEKNGPRTLDLDLLWASHARRRAHPTLPHPGLLERAFALVPAVAALHDAGIDVPVDMQRALLLCPGLDTLREMPASRR